MNNRSRNMLRYLMLTSTDGLLFVCPTGVIFWVIDTDTYLHDDR